MVVEVFAPETDKLAVTTEVGKVAFPAVVEVAGADCDEKAPGYPGYPRLRTAIHITDWLP